MFTTGNGRLRRVPVARYDAGVRSLVLTVIGDDRSGLVARLAQVIADHAGNWERSQMAELAGKFAGIVVVSVPESQVPGVTAALNSLDGLLAVSAYPGSDTGGPTEAPSFTIDLLGNDRPGIVREVSAVLHRHGLSIRTMDTATREAPMAGGQLFEAHIVAGVPPQADLSVVRDDLERLTAELLVDIDLS